MLLKKHLSLYLMTLLPYCLSGLTNSSPLNHPNSVLCTTEVKQSQIVQSVIQDCQSVLSHLLLACSAAGRVTKATVVCLRNSSQKLVLISRVDTRICVSISDWLVSYAPCDWSYSYEIYNAMLKIDIVPCIYGIYSVY